MSFLWVFVGLLAMAQAGDYHGGMTEWKVFEGYGNGSVLLKVTTNVFYASSSVEPALTFECYDGSTSGGISNFIMSNQVVTDTSIYAVKSVTQSTAYRLLAKNSACKMKSVTGGNWVSALYRQPSLSALSTFIDVRVRSDTGKINSAPVAVQQPLVRFVKGCRDSVLIPLRDDDGDRVSCRYALGQDEAGTVTNDYPYFGFEIFYSETNECEISYNGGGTSAKIPVALIVEDHPRNDPSRILSSNSLQFVIEVVNGDSCGSRPSFVTPTPSDGMTHTVLPGSDFHITLRATPTSQTESIDYFSIVTSSEIKKSSIQYEGNGVYATTLTWKPAAQEVGSNHFCYMARETSGLLSEQRCMILKVGDRSSACSNNNGGCSDKCEEDISYSTCTCEHNCWNVNKDGLECIPDITFSCSQTDMKIEVLKCAVDGAISIGNYDKNDPDADATAEKCESSSDDDVKHVFEYKTSECGISTTSTENELKHKTVIKMWVDSALEQPITRGQWFYVDVICSSEKNFNTSGSFNPEDSSTGVIVEEGFANISIDFSFYEDDSFGSALSPSEDTPLEVNVNEDLYFGITATSDDQDIELFTKTCIAKPKLEEEPPIEYTMIKDGCLVDSTMVSYPSGDLKINHFSIKAFRFVNSLDGTTEDNVIIECRVVVCVTGIPGTTCAAGCPDSARSRYKEFVISRYFVPDRRSDDVERMIPVQRRDPSIEETKESSPLTSMPFRITGIPSSTTATTTSGANKQSVFSFIHFISVLALSLSCGR